MNHRMAVFGIAIAVMALSAAAAPDRTRAGPHDAQRIDVTNTQAFTLAQPTAISTSLFTMQLSSFVAGRSLGDGVLTVSGAFEKIMAASHDSAFAYRTTTGAALPFNSHLTHSSIRRAPPVKRLRADSTGWGFL